MADRVGVGILGAGGWSEVAHVPSWLECGRARLVALCDVDVARARAVADRFGIDTVYADPGELLADGRVDVVDVCTTTATHEAMSRAALAAGKHVLSEKPVAESADGAEALAATAAAAGLRTKVMYTFRYSPAIRHVVELARSGALGTIYHVHGFEQNPQFLDPATPLRQVPADDGSGHLLPSSLVEYGSHLLNVMRACAGEVRAVTGSMQNFVPVRRLRGHDEPQRLAIEDATVALVEFASGAQGLVQTSHVAVGMGPGLELRVYGSEAAVIARLVVERDVQETFAMATRREPEFRIVEPPQPPFRVVKRPDAPWSQLYVRSLVARFADEVLDGGPGECDFAEGAASQRLLDAIIASHRRRGWVALG